MDDNPSFCPGRLHPALISFFSLLIFVALFFARALDDTRFTSWELLTAADATRILTALTVGMLFVYLTLKVSLPERYPAAFLFLFSFSAAALFFSEPEAVVDASRYFTYAKNIELYGLGQFIREWGHDINVWTDMPFVPLLYGLLFRYAGESRLYIQCLTALLFSATVVLTYLTGRALWDRDTGFIGGLLLMGIPYLFSQVPLMLVDVPTMFFLALSVYTFISAIEKGGYMIPVSAFSIAATFYVKYSTWITLSVLPVIVLVYAFEITGPARRAALIRALQVFVMAAAGVYIFFAYKQDVMSRQMRLLVDYQGPGLRRWGESLFAIFMFQVHPVITAAAVFATYRAVRKRDFKFLIISWLVFLVLALRIRRVRYIMILFPMLSLMASYGLRQLANRMPVKYTALCITAFSLAVAFFGFHPYLLKDSSMNLAKAGAFLDSLPGDSVEVLTAGSPGSEVNPAVSVSVLDLYTKKRIIYRYHPAQQPVREVLLKSPLRFTWEYRNPKYYDENPKYDERSATPDKAGPVAIIYSDSDYIPAPGTAEKIKGLRSKVFNATDNRYEYQSLVAVYYR